jgi:hypothetical protein
MDKAELVPLEAQMVEESVGGVPGKRLMAADTEINTFSLFKIADYGLTVRGTIGMALPCFGIPVATAGTGLACVKTPGGISAPGILRPVAVRRARKRKNSSFARH